MPQREEEVNKDEIHENNILSHTSNQSSDSATCVDENKRNDKLDNDEDKVLDLYTYHRGRVSEEPRDEKTGELLCDVKEKDTTHNWDPPYKFQMRIEFPLSDPDPPLTDANNKNANISREEMEYFREVMDWDLQDLHTPSPMEFSAMMAEEYGLSYGQICDLANSMQRQIDKFTRKHQYNPPMTITDPFGLPRPKDIPKPIIASTPKRASHYASKPSSTTKIPSTSRPKSNTARRGHTFQSNKEHRDEIMNRAKREYRSKQKSIALATGTEVQIYPEVVYNRFCHICHAKKEIGVAFNCGTNNHVYCNYHCEVSDFKHCFLLLTLSPSCIY